MRLIDADKTLQEKWSVEIKDMFHMTETVEVVSAIDIEKAPTVEAIPVWYIIRWYEKRYKLGSTVADDWERGLLKERIVTMNDDFKNEKYLDNKQESERFAQMVKEVIDLYTDWEEENETERSVLEVVY